MRNTTILTGCFVAVMAIIMPALFANAADFQAGERVKIEADEAIADDVYAAGGAINLVESIEGDLFTAGGDIVIENTVAEDLQTAGGSVNVQADTGGDARLVGGDITVSGSVAEDALLLGGQSQLSGDQIGGDLIWAGGKINVGSSVAGDVKLTGQEAFIDSTVSGDVEFKGQKLTLESDAVIEGDLTYESPHKAAMADTATVAGETTFEKVSQEEAQTLPDISGISTFFNKTGDIIGLLMRLVGALLIGLVFRRLAGEVTNSAFKRPLAEFGRGFAGLLIMPIAAVILLLTLIGVPLGILTFLIYGVFMIVAGFLAPIFVGTLIRELIQQTDERIVDWLTITLGVLVFALVGYIPLVGWLIQLILTLWALGAVIGITWRCYKAYRQ